MGPGLIWGYMRGPGLDKQLSDTTKSFHLVYDLLKHPGLLSGILRVILAFAWCRRGYVGILLGTSNLGTPEVPFFPFLILGTPY